jgi:hypothetical protein
MLTVRRYTIVVDWTPWTKERSLEHFGLFERKALADHTARRWRRKIADVFQDADGFTPTVEVMPVYAGTEAFMSALAEATAT